MALYHVMNLEATNGEASDALIVTNGRNKARRIFAEQFGGTAKSLIVKMVETSGEYVLSTTFTDGWADLGEAPTAPQWDSALDVGNEAIA